jgi:hypothetical protein
VALAIKPIVTIVFLVVVSIWTAPEALADGKITFCKVAYTDIDSSACDGLPLQICYPVIVACVPPAWFRANLARLAEASMVPDLVFFSFSTAADMMHQRVRPQVCATSHCNARKNTISCMCSVLRLCCPALFVNINLSLSTNCDGTTTVWLGASVSVA